MRTLIGPIPSLRRAMIAILFISIYLGFPEIPPHRSYRNRSFTPPILTK